jgi:N-acetylmuramoyl-L-alanine amidase
MKKKCFCNSVSVGLIILILISAIGIVYVFPNQIRSTILVIKDAGIQLASVILSHNFKSVADIKSNYNNPKKNVRILIVPGHEPNFGGAEFGGLKERDMTVELGQNLQRILENDSKYDVFISRDSQGWNPIFENYFADHKNEIAEWVKASHEEFSRLVLTGSTTRTYSTVIHNSAPKDVALRLYGLTKWSNENDIDIVIHIHFNDNPRRNVSKPGNYSGFSIYVPAKQYGMSASARKIAESISKRLAKYNPISNHPGEVGGLIDDPELIAVGSNNTADAASMLIEYSYIYEPQLQNPEVRSMAIKDLAFQTYLGLQDFFDKKSGIRLTKEYDTSILPYTWGTQFNYGASITPDIFALQTALMFGGVYPPNGRSKNDCPRTGNIGDCTRDSLDIFQDKNGIIGEKGMVGEQTLEALNRQ